MAQLLNTILAITAFFASFTYAVSPLVVKGSDFVNSVDDSRFQIIGVAYQPGGSSGFDPASGVDPLSNATVCLRDATLLQRLGVNAIRVYNLDPGLDHQECASIFNAAGIYMILDVNSPLPNQALDRGAPWNSYNYDYLNRVFQVVEAFMNFPNTLGFFSGNEVINEDAAVEVPGYLRAVTRDIKDYIAKQSTRAIPVGYSAAAVDELLLSSYEYLSCELDNATSSKIDFFGLNSYAWCGGATFQTSGFDEIVSEFSNTTIPVFFSEYGCNSPSPRTFTEVPVIYGPQMSGVLSGGIVYEYNEEVNNYGLVSLNGNGTASILQDYDNLRDQYNSLDISLLVKSNSTATSLTPPTCDPSLITASGFESTFAIPARPSGVDDLIDNGVSSPKSYPPGLSAVTSTDVTEIVYDVNGQPLVGLKLNILKSDQSNLPGGNTSGTSGNPPTTTSTTSSGTATATSAAVAIKGADVKTGQLVMGALSLGFLLRL